MDQGPNGALKTVFLNMAITLEGMNLETQIFFLKIEHQKIFGKSFGPRALKFSLLNRMIFRHVLNIP